MDKPAPTAAEVDEYAAYLGMDPGRHAHLRFVAEWALTAPLPEGWSGGHFDAAGAEFFYCARTGVSTFEHPLDELYRQYWRSLAARGEGGAHGGRLD